MLDGFSLKKGVQIDKALDLENCCIESDCYPLVRVVTGVVARPGWKCRVVIDDISNIFNSLGAAL